MKEGINRVRLIMRDKMNDHKDRLEDREEEVLGEIDIEELQMIIQRLENNKSPGVDKIPSEFLKYSSSNFQQALKKLFNQILKEGIIPKVWKEGKTTLIPKC